MPAETSVHIDPIAAIDEYLDRSDWRVNANANQGYSLGGLILNAAGKMVANYWLHSVYPEDVRKAHTGGDFHIHDLDMLAGYCAGWSLRDLLREGFNGIPGKTGSRPPRHLETALGQMVNFLGTLQNEWAGAQAFSSFDTLLAPYVKRDALPYDRVLRLVEQFVYNLNVPSRWGAQTPFTNITLDWNIPDDLRDVRPTIAGEEMPFTYAECQGEADMLNQAFIAVMSTGDKDGRVFTFPIPTYNVTKDFDWEHPNVRPLFEMSAKYGIPYFQNFVNSSLDPKDVRSMCCRLQLDLRKLRERGGGLFGSAEMTGSVGVVTLNMARIGFLSDGEEEFLTRTYALMDLAKESLERKRRVVERLMEGGLLPFTKRYLGTLRHHFSTIGINGMHEACLNLLGVGIESPEGKAFAERTLDAMRERLVIFQRETGHLYNLEATPAEGATYRLAKADQARFPGIVQAGTASAPYYTNSSHLPVGHTDDVLAALDHQDGLQARYTGGTVLHLFLGERMADWQACASLVRKVVQRYRLPYITVTPTFSICPSHGYLRGESRTCPSCDSACEVWSRIVGYYRPVGEWNVGKKQEYADREEYARAETAPLCASAVTSHSA